MSVWNTVWERVNDTTAEHFRNVQQWIVLTWERRRAPLYTAPVGLTSRRTLMISLLSCLLKS